MLKQGNDKITIVRRVLPTTWLFIGIIWDIWYYVSKGKTMLDSDMASEMVLADILNKENSITGLTTSWLYDEELRFINIHSFLRIGLAVSPNNWHMARVVGTTIALLTMAFAIWLVFYSINRTEWGGWTVALAVLPGGSWYFWQTIYGGYYMIYIIIPMLSIAMMMLSLKSSRKWKKWMFCMCGGLFSFCLGVNGIKSIMFFYAPLMLAAVLYLLMRIHAYELKRDVFGDKGFHIFWISFTYSLAAGIGYLLNSQILSNIFSYDNWSGTRIRYAGFLDLLRYYLWSFGYQEDKALMSYSGIACMCGVAFGIIVFLSGICLVKNLHNIEENEQFLVILSLTCILFAAFIFSYVDNGDIQYYQPIVPYGYILIVIGVFTVNFKHEKDVLISICFVIFLLAIASAGTIYSESDGPLHNFRARTTLYPVVEYLKESGYTQGVGLFWTTNLITELSDGTIDMWTIDDPSQDYMSCQQKTSHMNNDPQGRYFYIFDYGREKGYLQEWYDKETEVGMIYINKHPFPTELKEIYNDDTFVVFGN